MTARLDRVSLALAGATSNRVAGVRRGEGIPRERPGAAQLPSCSLAKGKISGRATSR